MDFVYVLLGVSDNTAENETFVYFIGVFESLLLAKENLTRLMETTKTKLSDYIIKKTYLNKTYNYDWSNNEEDEVK